MWPAVKLILYIYVLFFSIRELRRARRQAQAEFADREARLTRIATVLMLISSAILIAASIETLIFGS